MKWIVDGYRSVFLKQKINDASRSSKDNFASFKMRCRVDNVIKQLVHAAAVRMSRYWALGKFGEHSRRLEHSLFVICNWWISIRFVSFGVSSSLLVILLWPKPDVNIPNIFWEISSLDVRLPNFDEVKILKIQINFWDGKSAIKCSASRAFFPICLLPCTKRSHGRHLPRFV